jgi:hypothetical protein
MLEQYEQIIMDLHVGKLEFDCESIEIKGGSDFQFSTCGNARDSPFQRNPVSQQIEN